MQLALVMGNTDSSIYHHSLKGKKMLVCRVLDINNSPSEDPIIVIDRHGAGKGDVILLTSDGRGIRNFMNDNTTPIRWMTLGVVDNIEVKTA